MQNLGIFGGVKARLNPNYIVQISKDTAQYIKALNAPDLPTLQIDMKFKHFHKIEEKREEALQKGLLFASDDDLVPAEIKFQDRTIPVKMRLKGDLLGHLKTDKWSYRIQVKGNDQFLGMRRFSIQPPMTRGYLYEWGWLEHLRREGVLAPKYQFVNVTFNGTDKGVYAVEEHFSKELLESQQRREGVILTFDENLFWQNFQQSFQPMSSFLDADDIRNSTILARRQSRINQNPVLSQERDTAIALLKGFQDGKLKASEVFDISLMAKFLAVCDFWKAYHALRWHNINFYYNPITAKLEPIGFDRSKTRESPPLNLFVGGHYLEPWINLAMQDPALAEAYVQELSIMSKPKYLEQIHTEIKESFEQLQLALYRDSFPHDQATLQALKRPIWEHLKERQEVVRSLLDQKNMIVAFAQKENQSDRSTSRNIVQIEVRNMLTQPVEVIGLQVGEEFIPAEDAWVDSVGEIYNRDRISSIVLPIIGQEFDQPVKNALFRVPIKAQNQQLLDNNQIPEIKVVTRLLGLLTSQETQVHPYPKNLTKEAVPIAPTVEEALAKYPFLEKGETDNILLLKKGEWDVQGNLVLPKGIQLKAKPGTTLKFEKDAIFLSRGPLEFLGTAEKPIVLAPKEDAWGGLVVLEAKLPSKWEHVIVKNTRGIGTGVNIEGVDRQGWILTGGINFYKSPISLNYCRILGSKAEDGINVILSAFEFKNSEFANVVSDAFDGDFVEGFIQSSSFHDVAGDAIDVSGSNIKVKDVVLKDVIDKAISAGEGSTIEATNIQAVNLGIGVASKDLSKVKVDSMLVENAQHAGLAAYEKKPEFGSANITANNIEFKNTSQNTLVQTGSWIDLDGKRIEGTELDVKAMYKAGILGN